MLALLLAFRIYTLSVARNALTNSFINFDKLVYG
ncbi:hypothetical protein FHU10_2183 [Serratia fonticola]|uniref:Uncharacterized protein n=1 Tax=Serratia fonticola TaxID=47917 RepID=A0A542BGY4_SERFO|nr:hypothetical protein FHU09_0268 [Serratia fonticola]TQI95157.1 hypothetical protein FHU11_0524 [Serratia fonticola]TVZ69655.1 hypothetical protein FHU10_2183 [Serratia fonticola]